MGWDGPILTDSGGFQVFSPAAHDPARRRRRRHLPLGLRRRPRALHAGARRGDPGGARLGHRHVPRHLPAGGRAAARARGGGAAHDRVGAQADRGRRARPASSASGSPRARPTRSSAAARSTSSSRSASTATRSAACPSGRTARAMFEATAWAAPLLPADRPRYFMGIGDPEGILAAIERGHRHVRLRPADADRAHRLGAHVGGAPEPEERALRRATRARSTSPATAPRAAASAGPTSGT